MILLTWPALVAVIVVIAFLFSGSGSIYRSDREGLQDEHVLQHWDRNTTTTVISSCIKI